MNIKEIKQLLELVKEHDLAEFELEREGSRIVLKKFGAPQLFSPGLVPHAYPPQLPGTGEASTASKTGAEDSDLFTITSPIVGTFYLSPSPEAEPFVRIGSSVGPSDTVCLIEAMKVMNEIKADITGTIVTILVENGQAVEYGQPLFRVR